MDLNEYLSMGAGGSREKASVTRERLLESEYTRILIELCANRFKWKGLPASVDVRYLELTILKHALSVFYYEQKYGRFVSMQGAPVGLTNMQDEPVSFTIPRRGITEMGGKKSRWQSVPIWGNYTRSSDMGLIAIFAQRLAQIDRTIEINTKQARRPTVLAGNKNQRHTLTMINNQIDEGIGVIGIGNGVDMEQIKAFDMGFNPQTIEQNHISRGRVWNQCMSLLGINNANQDKKERLVSDEVAANDEQVSAMKSVYLNARQHAAEEINRMFDGSPEHAAFTGYTGEPLNVSVEFNTEPDPMAEFMGGAAEALSDEEDTEDEEDNA